MGKDAMHGALKEHMGSMYGGKEGMMMGPMMGKKAFPSPDMMEKALEATSVENLMTMFGVDQEHAERIKADPVNAYHVMPKQLKKILKKMVMEFKDSAEDPASPEQGEEGG